MKKLTLFFMFFLIILMSSCQLISTLINQDLSIKLQRCENDLASFAPSPSDSGSKIVSIELNGILLIAYIDLTNNTLKFYVKSLTEENIEQTQPLEVYDSMNPNNVFQISTDFPFELDPHPIYYLPVIEKVGENYIKIFYLDSQYHLYYDFLKLTWDYLNKKYLFQILDPSPIMSDTIPGYSVDHNAILYDLQKSNKIAHFSLWNDQAFIYHWDKNNIGQASYANFNIQAPDLTYYTLYSSLYTTIVECDINKIFAANIGVKDGTENYLIINRVNLEDNTYEKIYDSFSENKITYNIPIKLVYIEELNKLYVAWGYQENSKNYLAISEFDFIKRKLNDRLRIDITGTQISSLDIKRSKVNGINGSNLNIVYSTVGVADDNKFVVAIIKTNNFSDSNWSIFSICDELISSSKYFANIVNSSYLILNVSKYLNSNTSLQNCIYIFK